MSSSTFRRGTNKKLIRPQRVPAIKISAQLPRRDAVGPLVLLAQEKSLDARLQGLNLDHLALDNRVTN